MTSAKDVVMLILDDIDTDIRILKASHDFAESKMTNAKYKKRSAMESGMGYMIASEEFDSSIGYYTGIADECESRIKELQTRRNLYLSLYKQYAEEGEENE